MDNQNNKLETIISRYPKEESSLIMVLQESFVGSLEEVPVDIVDFFLPYLLVSQTGEFSLQIGTFLLQMGDLLFEGYPVVVFHAFLDLRATMT